jgi:hypothetical protein
MCSVVLSGVHAAIDLEKLNLEGQKERKTCSMAKKTRAYEKGTGALRVPYKGSNSRIINSRCRMRSAHTRPRIQDKMQRIENKNMVVV